MVNRRRGGIKLDIVTSAPNTKDLEVGELVFCTADNKLYFKDETNTVITTVALS